MAGHELTTASRQRSLIASERRFTAAVTTARNQSSLASIKLVASTRSQSFLCTSMVALRIRGVGSEMVGVSLVGRRAVIGLATEYSSSLAPAQTDPFEGSTRLHFNTIPDCHVSVQERTAAVGGRGRLRGNARQALDHFAEMEPAIGTPLITREITLRVLRIERAPCRRSRT